MELIQLAEKDFIASRRVASDEDEQFFSLRCYFLQQSVEKLLKCGITIRGSRYSKSHDIRDLYRACLDLGWAEVEGLETLQDTLTLWESKSRYNINFVAELKDIKLAEKVYIRLKEQLLSYVDKEFTSELRQTAGEFLSAVKIQ